MSQPNSPSPWVISTTDEQFEVDVNERSRQVPVVVDFWAEWCQPCRLLTPLLEELAQQYQGRFVLVKANTETNQRATLQMGVQSIPAIFGIIDGQLIDFFAGVPPQDQVQGWLDRLLRIASLAEAKRIEATDAARARQLYETALEQEPDCADAEIGLARLALAQGQLSACREIIDRLERRGFLESEAEKVKAALELQQAAGTELEPLRQAAEKEPDNLQAQLALAKGLAAQQQFEPALQTALSVVQQDKKELGESARQLMVDIFLVLPEGSELASQYRRKLSMALF